MKYLFSTAILSLSGLCFGKEIPILYSDTISNLRESLMSQFVTDCDPIININGPEQNSNYLYSAKTRINVGNAYRITANSNANITMKAGKVIVLKPGIAVLKGNKYLARIEPCDQGCESTFTYEKFFTPNGDGINDFWNIRNIENMTDVKIYIFDRYGKLLKSLRPLEPGWDGSYNSNVVFANDYWFRLTYKDCQGNHREVKSHFSLVK